MRRYETIIIVDPDLSDEGRNQRFEKIKELLKNYKGHLVEFDEWGGKKLAYEIKKKMRGYYVKFDFCSEADFVKELERTIKLDDRILKFMTILLEDKADPEKIKAGMIEKVEEEEKTSDDSTDNSSDNPETESEETEKESESVEEDE